MQWAHPQAFLLLLLLPLAFWPLRLRQRGSTPLSGLQARLATVGGLAHWGPLLLTTLRALALILLVTTLARPQTAQSHATAYTEGIAIQLVLDTSLSMGYTDYIHERQSISRMDAAKHAIRLFIKGEPQYSLPGRPHDQIGLVGFNRYPDVVCPLTTAHDTLLASLDDVALGPYTNIGDGLAWGIDRVRRASPRQKIIILLSDGKQNAPEAMNPLAAGKLAGELGIRVYTIGAIGNTSLSAMNRLPGSPPPISGDSVDEQTLERIAALTGGKYFRATDTEGLLAIYREIDALEKSRIEQSGAATYDEWFLWFLIPGLIGLALEQLLASTRLLVVG